MGVGRSLGRTVAGCVPQQASPSPSRTTVLNIHYANYWSVKSAAPNSGPVAHWFRVPLSPPQKKKKKKKKADNRISFSGYCWGLAQVCQVCFAVHGLVSARMPLPAREEALDFIFPFNLNSPLRDDATNWRKLRENQTWNLSLQNWPSSSGRQVIIHCRYLQVQSFFLNLLVFVVFKLGYFSVFLSDA